MVRLLLRRLLEAALALWGLASLVFLLGRAGPAGPEDLLVPDAADLSSRVGAGPAAQAQLRRAVRERLGLDVPVFYVSRVSNSPGQPRWRWHGRRNQYHRWLVALGRGDLGRSVRTGQPVAAQLATTLAYTVPLTGAALLLAAGLALALGSQLAAPRRWWHGPVRAALVGLHGTPLFVVALGLLLLLANPQVLDWFPVYGLGTDDAPWTWANGGGRLAHLVLPVASLVLVALPDLVLQLEASVRQELRAGYVTTARAKGLGLGAVVRRHALPNALLPTLTQLTELVPTLVAGALVVEVVFALPGMGRLLAAAAAQHDYPVLVGGVLLTGGARLGAQLLAEVLYRWADPRISWQQ